MEVRKIEETKFTSKYILEIPKIKEEELGDNELVQWLKFIEDSENKEVQRVMGENKYLKQAKEELAYLSGAPSFQREVEARVRMLRDMHRFEHKGCEEGLVAGKKEIAKKMKAKNMPIDEIIELTGLTKEEIDAL